MSMPVKGHDLITVLIEDVCYEDKVWSIKNITTTQRAVLSLDFRGKMYYM